MIYSVSETYVYRPRKAWSSPLSSATLEPQEVRLPLSTVANLEHVLAEESPRLLADLGQETGEALASIDATSVPNPNEGSVDGFWSDVSDFFSSRGWMSLSWEQPHPGIGLLRATSTSEHPVPEQFFAATLEGFLSSVIGSRVVVMTVSDAGDPGEVVFAVGNSRTLARLNEELEPAAASLAAALEQV